MSRQLIRDLARIPQRPSEPVEFRHDEGVSASHCGKRLPQSRSGAIRAGHPGFFDLPATGRPFSYRQMHMIRIVDGKGAEHWAVRDDATLMRQLTGPVPQQQIEVMLNHKGLRDARYACH